MAFVFSIVETQEQPTLFVKTVTPVGALPGEIGKAYGAIAGYVAQKGEQLLGPPYVAYFNMDMQNLQVEIGFPVAKPIAGAGDIQAGSIPAGKKATAFYKGAYTGMGPTYEALAKWTAERGYTPTGTAYEFYFNAPQDVPESELLTQIAFLLQ